MRLLFGLSVLLFLAHCGGGVDSLSDELSLEESAAQFDPDVNPFEGGVTGEDFSWGRFIRSPYETTSVDELPLPLYLASFTDSEKEIVEEGIAIANEAVGFEMFQTVEDWRWDARVIYKVDEIFFDDPEYEEGSGEVIGYTMNRNIYVDGKHDAGRIVTDFAVEIRASNLSQWVVAHELGHAMGIQEHALIDYEEDGLLPLEDNSLMNASLSLKPALDDYYYMMEEQGLILLENIQGDLD